jgi:16S rRNA G966 N2-methylase RsmD
MNLRIKILRIYRGLSYLLNFLILELPRGLDISLRSKNNGITLLGNHGYASTSRSALKNMLDGIELKNKSFLDIGSGKGGVIIYSHQLGCASSAGIEYEKSLHDIAVKNIAVLKLKLFCTSYNLDARKFKDYSNIDIFSCLILLMLIYMSRLLVQ